GGAQDRLRKGLSSPALISAGHFHQCKVWEVWVKMKSSLRRLRGFALHKHEHKQRREKGLVAYQDELLQATQNVMTFYSSIMLVMYMQSVLTNMFCFTFFQDIHDIRNFYDSLLSAAAATTNSAYVAYLLCISWIAFHLMHVGRILLMLGRAQLELQKLVDIYVSLSCFALFKTFFKGVCAYTELQ
ncbi:hypothetical protein BHE74_00019468, partial [Ensete ventricosum]